MINKYKGIKCPVCDAEFAESDNIVVCPACGTPHHYDCYHSLSHCANEHRHEHDYVFSLPEADDEPPAGSAGRGHVCPRCRNISTSDTLFCPYCGYAFGTQGYSPEKDAESFQTPVTPFSLHFADPLGGIDPTENIDGIAVSEMTLFVGPNTHRYLPKFVDFCHRAPKKTSWNWLAFFFPHMWFAGRKMNKQALLASILSITFSLFNLPFLAVWNNIGSTLSQELDRSQLYAAILQKLLANPSLMPASTLLITLAGFALAITLRVLCGLFGDYIYKQHAVHKIKGIQDNEKIEDKELYIRSGGGVNIFIGLLVYFVVTQLTNMLMLMIF